MNSIATNLNQSFTWLAERRPLSHAAAVALLGTSIVAVHEGAKATGLPPALIGGATAAIVAAEWLQWTGLGRLAKIQHAGQDVRAGILKLQCFGIGLVQVALYTIAVVAIAGEAGQDWSHGAAFYATIAGAVVYAALNFVAKWTSCDPVDAPRRPPGATRVHDALFSSPLPALPSASESEQCCDDVGVIRLEDRLKRHRAFNDADDQARATIDRPVAERLFLAKKRLQTRARRELKRAAA